MDLELFDIPIEFLIRNCSNEQKEMTKIKWRLWQFVNEFKGSKSDAFYEFSQLPGIGLSDRSVRDLYFKVKKATETI